MKNAIILGAGKGTRMKSELPKVLHKVNGKTMIRTVYDHLLEAGIERVVAVVGFKYELVEEEMEGLCEFAVQEPQLGTGHAVMQAKQLEDEDGITLVVSGDCPCVHPETYAKLYEVCEDADMVLLTCKPEDTAAYGRIIRKEDNTVDRIVEFKDCNEEEKAAREVNAGIYAFNTKALFEGLKELNNDNAQNEYYITDLVEIFNNQNRVVKAVVAEDEREVQGVNNHEELKKAEEYLKTFE